MAEQHRSIFEESDDNTSIGDNSDTESIASVELFKRFIREAIAKLTPEQMSTIIGDEGKLFLKLIRQNLGRVLVDKLETVRGWDDDQHLTRLGELVDMYMEEEDLEDYSPAVVHALNTRKEIVNDVIREVCRDMQAHDEVG